MTPSYYYDKERNEFRGPLTQEYPDMTGNQMLDEDNLVEFWNHVRELPSHPHTFSGESHVVPEGEIEWELCDCDKFSGGYTHCKKLPDEGSRRIQKCKIAKPITVTKKDQAEEYLQGILLRFKKHLIDGQIDWAPNLEAQIRNYAKLFSAAPATPINEPPGYTSTSGEEVGANDYPGHQCGLSKFEWQMEKVIDEIRSKETTLECMAPLAKFLQSQQPPLTAQPDKQGEEQDEFKIAIRALEIMAIEHKLPIDIKYRPKMNTISQKKGWTIKTMDSVFNDDSFVEASRKACAFIYNSKGLNDEQ